MGLANKIGEVKINPAKRGRPSNIWCIDDSLWTSMGFDVNTKKVLREM